LFSRNREAFPISEIFLDVRVEVIAVVETCCLKALTGSFVICRGSVLHCRPFAWISAPDTADTAK